MRKQALTNDGLDELVKNLVPKPMEWWDERQVATPVSVLKTDISFFSKKCNNNIHRNITSFQNL